MPTKGNFKNLKGKIFNRLTVLRFSHTNKILGAFWECKCQCGNILTLRGNALKSGNTKSCGCYKKDKTVERNQSHLMSKTKFYHCWQHIKSRIFNPKDKRYSIYGGKGIKICQRWLKFENFKQDMYESYLAHVKEFRENNTTIERIDFNKDYKPNNCKWATKQEQGQNTSRIIWVNYKGNRVRLNTVALDLGISYKALRARMDRGKLQLIRIK